MHSWLSGRYEVIACWLWQDNGCIVDQRQNQPATELRPLAVTLHKPAQCGYQMMCKHRAWIPTCCTHTLTHTKWGCLKSDKNMKYFPCYVINGFSCVLIKCLFFPLCQLFPEYGLMFFTLGNGFTINKVSTASLLFWYYHCLTTNPFDLKLLCSVLCMLCLSPIAHWLEENYFHLNLQ